MQLLQAKHVVIVVRATALYVCRSQPLQLPRHVLHGAGRVDVTCSAVARSAGTRDCTPHAAASLLCCQSRLWRSPITWPSPTCERRTDKCSRACLRLANANQAHNDCAPPFSRKDCRHKVYNTRAAVRGIAQGSRACLWFANADQAHYCGSMQPGERDHLRTEPRLYAHVCGRRGMGEEAGWGRLMRCCYAARRSGRLMLAAHCGMQTDGMPYAVLPGSWPAPPRT